MFRVKVTILLAVMLTLIFYQSSFAFDDGDFQYWNTESASWKIDDNWRINLEQEFRWGDDAGNPYYRHTDLGAAYSGFADWLDLGLNYRHINEEKSDDWKTENRPHLNATVKFNLGEFKLSNRGRFEYRNREDADNFWQYRNKLSIKCPLKMTELEIQPYLADETFTNFDSEEMSRNRLYSGFSLKIWKNLAGDIYYVWQRSKSSSSGKWSDVYVLGTKLKLSF